MCGIIGYIGIEECYPIIMDGLRKMEYRGYDSYGIAVCENHKIELRKHVGKISEDGSKSIPGKMGIGHTRWATHGNVTEKNAHPHFDNKKDIAIVHNGIIENFSWLKKMLEKHGHKFRSDTDSEVIAHLIETYYKGDLEKAVYKAVGLLEGTYGILAIQMSEEKIVAARNGSPVVIGVSESGNIIASDVSAIVQKTKDIIYLKDGQMASVTKDNVRIMGRTFRKIENEIEKIEWDIKEIEKKGFKHFMLKEIMEQPESLQNTMLGRIKNDSIKLSTGLSKDFLQNMRRVVITACGTSWHAAIVGKYLIEKMCNIPVEVDYASEFRYRDPLIGKDDLVIVISQSGETADTLAALHEAKKKGVKTLGIVNVVGSTIARESENGIYIHAGPEIGVASTKAFTSQIISLILLALSINQELGKNVDEELLKSLKSIPEKISSVLETSAGIRNVAEYFYNHPNALYLGRGINFPVALEGALKLKEISYIHAEGYPAAEMKHGPIALVDEKMPVVFIANKNGESYKKIMSNMQEIKARNGVIITIATEGDEEIKKISDHVIYVPKCREELMPIINTIPLQLLAYHIADLKGLDPDKPKNLAKSVTVE
ncbi:MAG: glutamine--fructose-6-phosphate transaminase (isomerizing) [Candidatus Aenigmarchaeota archaeon]|nr:glutamine--fructose-6-phosphate transaminase (isomerizing) [Candidatus Aenigmarchaeota archaeon]